MAFPLILVGLGYAVLKYGVKQGKKKAKKTIKSKVKGNNR